ncbi:MAG: hypothetical protein ACI88C_002905, partial [Acidimicrobiales bacterium]
NMRSGRPSLLATILVAHRPFSAYAVSKNLLDGAEGRYVRPTEEHAREQRQG